MRRAAISTASTIRGYVPHLHTLPCIARTISALDGFEFVRKRPAPDTIIPGVQ
jgi:hypothetical protein